MWYDGTVLNGAITLFWMLVHVYPIMTKIIQITDQIQITDPDYGSGITDPGVRIWITDLDYGLRIRKWNTDRDKFGNDRLKMN